MPAEHRPQDASPATAYSKAHIDTTIAMLSKRFAIAPAIVRERFAERAAILEYEGGLDRLRAETRAFVELALGLQRAAAPPPRPSVTHYRGHIVVCTRCGHPSKAETLHVARERDREHAVKCDAGAKKQAEAELAAANQGRLF